MMDIHSKVVIRVFLLSIEAGNCLLHVIGLYLLFHVYRGEPKDTQKLCLINLAFSELMWNSVLVVRDMIKIFHLLGYSQNALNTAFWCLSMFLATGVTYINISAMFYLTADRLMQILLHLRYAEYWNVGKTRIVFIITWSFNILLSITALTYTFYNFEYVRHEIKLSKILSVYVMTSLFFIYILFAMFTYFTLFCVYVKSEQKYFRKHSSSGVDKSVVKIFIESRFFLSVILIGSYLLLTVFPSLIRAIWYLVSYSTFTYHMTAYYLLSTRLSHTVDAVLYIFAQRSVRDVIFRKYRAERCFTRKLVVEDEGEMVLGKRQICNF